MANLRSRLYRLRLYSQIDFNLGGICDEYDFVRIPRDDQYGIRQENGELPISPLYKPNQAGIGVYDIENCDCMGVMCFLRREPGVASSHWAVRFVGVLCFHVNISDHSIIRRKFKISKSEVMLQTSVC